VSEVKRVYGNVPSDRIILTLTPLEAEVVANCCYWAGGPDSKLAPLAERVAEQIAALLPDNAGVYLHVDATGFGIIFNDGRGPLPASKLWDRR
jgi:hypothetical protein